jgi:ABC-2 type transport system ATP-binding protein
MVPAIEVSSLSRVFDGKKGREPLVALDGIDLTVEEGELFGLLGPNGAGKTTLIKILSTLLLPSFGKVKVLGHDVEKEAQRIRPRINMVSGGETSGYGLLTVRENLWMFSQFYGVPGKEANRRIDEMLEIFELKDKANAKVRTISTGQRQKMNVVRGFVTNPDLIFLDEPTLGLDVNASITIRNYIRRWVKGQSGKTVLLTTHYMAEADSLCDRVAVIDRGRILACDTPRNLRRLVHGSSVFTVSTSAFSGHEGLSALAGVKGFEGSAANGSVRMRFSLDDESVIADVVSYITTRGGKILSLSKEEATLEDVFIQMVGRGLE